MKADISCKECCVKKAKGLLTQYKVPEVQRAQVLEQIGQYLENIDEEKSSPVLMSAVMSMVGQQIDIAGSYDEMKQKYNAMLLKREERIYEDIRKEEDLFLAALQYAVTGNYIDFGAMSDVKEEKLNELLNQRAQMQLDVDEIHRLREELESAERMVYITDNAGEIVLDKILIRLLREWYPKLQITVIVRGFPVLNDATLKDAKMIGLCDLVRVIGNGTDIPGTSIPDISAEAREVIETADLCIAKGQGNFETLQGCGENIYYIFLCKCDLFLKKFQVARFTPALKNEKRIVHI